MQTITVCNDMDGKPNTKSEVQKQGKPLDTDKENVNDDNGNARHGTLH